MNGLHLRALMYVCSKRAAGTLSCSRPLYRTRYVFMQNQWTQLEGHSRQTKKKLMRAFYLSNAGQNLILQNNNKNTHKFLKIK